MQLRSLFILGLLFGAEAAQVVRRQNTPTVIESSIPNDETTTAPPSSPTSSPPTSPSDDSGSTTPTDDGGDTTVTRTTTVTDDNADTVTQRTTFLRTITSTIVITKTEFETITVTSRGAETATRTIYETSTEWANEKRAINLAPRTVGLEEFEVEAKATDVPTVTRVDVHELVRHKRGNLQKRATVTAFVTVTVGNDAVTTTIGQTRTVISTVSSETTAVSTVTETEQADARTTVTTTSTLTVTSTAVTTGVVRTETVAPSGSYGPGETGGADSGNNNNNNGGGDSGGLSTGAKAGIGAGVGVGALIVLGGLLWFCLKKRRSGPKPDPDDMFGSSEVPVGGTGSTPPPVSQTNRDAAAAIIAPRRIPVKPSSPEGYRGTARGDGRSGFAKPDQFGAAYTNNVSPETNYSRTTAADTYPDVAEMQSPANTAELSNDSAAAKWHESNAAEIDGNQVSRPQTGPGQNVYEMPAQPYR